MHLWYIGRCTFNKNDVEDMSDGRLTAILFILLVALAKPVSIVHQQNLTFYSCMTAIKRKPKETNRISTDSNPKVLK
jgi:hypothetical protein